MADLAKIRSDGPKTQHLQKALANYARGFHIKMHEGDSLESWWQRVRVKLITAPNFEYRNQSGMVPNANFVMLMDTLMELAEVVPSKRYGFTGPFLPVKNLVEAEDYGRPEDYGRSVDMSDYFPRPASAQPTPLDSKRCGCIACATGRPEACAMGTLFQDGDAQYDRPANDPFAVISCSKCARVVPRGEDHFSVKPSSSPLRCKMQQTAAASATSLLNPAPKGFAGAASLPFDSDYDG